MEWLRSSKPFVSYEKPPAPPIHPYYPITLMLPSFVANDRAMAPMLAGFFAMWVVVFGSAWTLSSWWSPRLGGKDKTILMWFVLCGTLHSAFEGYFVFHSTTFGSKQDLFAQVWKEYALSDSRYMSGDPTVLCAEAITAVLWGPLSFMTAILIANDSPFRHPFQIIISLGQLYGDVLYLSTSLVDLYVKSVSYSRPEPYYFWFYFMFLNLIWVFVPGLLLLQSTLKVAEAFSAINEIQKIYQGEPSKKPAAQVHGRMKLNREARSYKKTSSGKNN